MHTLRHFLQILAKILTFLFLILSLALIGISLFKKEWIELGIKWVGELIHTLGSWNYLIAFLSAGIESLPFIGTAVPGMNVMILVGGFWAKEHFFFTIICAILGAMIGNYMGYWIGKYYGKELIHKYGEWFGIGRTEENILKKQIEKNGFWYIVLGKFHNFTRAFIPFIAGSSKMLERHFWLYNMIGSVIWALSINLLGIFFIANYQDILEHLGKIMTGFLIAGFGYMYFFRREALTNYWKEKQREIEEKTQTHTPAHHTK